VADQEIAHARVDVLLELRDDALEDLDDLRLPLKEHPRELRLRSFTKKLYAPSSKSAGVFLNVCPVVGSVYAGEFHPDWSFVPSAMTITSGFHAVKSFLFLFEPFPDGTTPQIWS
jgi:hypothetical protein